MADFVAESKPRIAPVVDMMEALKKSLAIAKKPMASEAEAPKQKAEGKKQKAAR